jgi:hypothetical protein
MHTRKTITNNDIFRDLSQTETGARTCCSIGRHTLPFRHEEQVFVFCSATSPHDFTLSSYRLFTLLIGKTIAVQAYRGFLLCD